MLLMTSLLQIIAAIIAVESGGDPSAIGDNGAAFGALQIHAAYVADANAHSGNNWKHEDAFDTDVAIEIFKAYMSRYAVSSKTGQPISAEIICRIHNGGPSGWKRDSTLPYWNKVKKELLRQQQKGD